MTHPSWGPGWPNCQGGKINRGFYVDTAQGRISFPGGVRSELCELVSRLVKETVNRGYRFGKPGDPSYGCWGFNCRAIRGSNKPSNHSWGLAVDINAPTNPMGSPLRTNMPSWMPDLWNAYGFRWGGDYATRPDAMHYEFMGSVQECAAQTKKARDNRLGEGKAPAPKPPAPKPPTPAPKPSGVKMLYLVKGPTGSTYITDWVHKRVANQEDIDVCLWVTTGHGAPLQTDKGKPIALSAEQADVLARIPNA